jgi:hypothetical protein
MLAERAGAQHGHTMVPQVQVHRRGGRWEGAGAHLCMHHLSWMISQAEDAAGCAAQPGGRCAAGLLPGLTWDEAALLHDRPMGQHAALLHHRHMHAGLLLRRPLHQRLLVHHLAALRLQVRRTLLCRGRAARVRHNRAGLVSAEGGTACARSRQAAGSTKPPAVCTYNNDVSASRCSVMQGDA